MFEQSFAARNFVRASLNLAILPSDHLRSDGGTYLNDFISACHGGELVVFDTETTGLDVFHDDIVQIDQVARDAAGQNPVAPKRCVWYILAVSNDGAPCTKTIVPGGGLTGMRAACEALGAAFEVEAGPPFMVRVSAPVVVDNGDDDGGSDDVGMADDSPCGANDTHEI